MKKKEHQNSGTLGKDTINNWIIPFLSVGKRGFKSNFGLASIFLLIPHFHHTLHKEFLHTVQLILLKVQNFKFVKRITKLGFL